MSQILLGMVSSSLLRPATGLTIDPVINIAEREAAYRANSRMPNLVPNPGQIMEALWAHKIRPATAVRELLCSGIYPTAPRLEPGAVVNPNWTENRETWYRLLELAKPRVPFEQMRKWWLLTGRRHSIAGGGQPYTAFSSEHLEERLRIEGLDDDWQVQALRDLPNLLDISAVWRAYLLGILSREQVDEYLKQLGYLRDADRNIVLAQTQTIDATSAILLSRRGILADEQLAASLRAAGYADLTQQRRLIRASESIPGLADGIGLLNRQAYNSDSARRFGLDESIPAMLLEYARSNGWDHGPRSGVRDENGNDLPLAALWYWRAAKQLPGEQQAREYLYRLRPEAVRALNAAIENEGDTPDPNLRAFTEDDYRAALRAQGWPEPAIAWSLHTATQLPNTRRMQQALYYRIMTYDEVADIYQSQGFNPDYARIMAQIDHAAAMDRADPLGKQLLLKYRRTAVDGTLKAYAVAAMSREDAITDIVNAGVEQRLAGSLVDQYKKLVPALDEYALVESTIKSTVADTETLYELGAISDAEAKARLSQLGLSASTMQTIINRIQLKTRMAIARAGIASVKRDFRAGIIDANTAVAKLTGSGITIQRAQAYLQQWQLQMSDIGRRMTTAQILGLVKDGLLKSTDAESRLRNLGWSQPDALILLADLSHKTAVSERKAQQAAQVKTAKAAAQAAKAIATNQKAAVAALKRQAGEATLSKWLKNGLITESEFYTLMEARGYGLDYIERYAQAALTPTAPKSSTASGT